MRSMGWIPGQGTKILHATQLKRKGKKFKWRPGYTFYSPHEFSALQYSLEADCSPALSLGGMLWDQVTSKTSIMSLSW